MRLALALLLVWPTLPAAAVTCEDVSYLGKSYTACTVDPAVDDLRLFHKNGDSILGSFRAIEGLPDVTALPFAMNAGMNESSTIG